MLSGHHAGQDGVVRTLDARKIDEAGAVADQRAARKHQLGHRLPAAFVDGARPVGDALAALEGPPDAWVLLEALEFLERRDVWVAIVQVHDEPDRDLLVLQVIEERTAAGALAERPAEGVLHQAGLVFLRRD